LLAPDVRHLDLAQPRRGMRSQGGVAVLARAPYRTDGRGEAGVVDTVAQQGAQVVAMGGEQAGEELAFGGQAGTRTVGAEGAGDGGDHADLATAVAVAPALGDLARIVRIDRLD